MGVVKLSTAGILNYSKTSNFLSGNELPAGPSAFDLLETTTLTSSAASVTFSGLSAYSDYKHLQIRMVARSDFSNIYNDALHANLTFNSDTASNYNSHNLWANGSQVYSQDEGNPSNISLRYTVAVGSNTTNGFAASVTDILDFSNVYKNTTTRTLNGYTGGNNAPAIQLRSGLWRNTNAVTSMNIASNFGNFVSGTRFSLFGVR